jgi:uncharacterized protein (TIGR02145 family)
MMTHFKTLVCVLAAVVLCIGCNEKPDEEGDGNVSVTTGTFTDSRNNKIYKTVKIGNQTWFAENLNYDVPNVDTDVCYDNEADSCAKYGRLYNWVTAMGIDASYNSTYWGGSDAERQGVCPVGWHLPSDAEWTQLTNFVGGASTAGTKLKSTSGWNNGGNGTDGYRFSALPNGSGDDGAGGYLYYAGNFGSWWSATEDNAINAWYRYMNYDKDSVGSNYGDKTGRGAVRCVQN